MLRGHKRSLDIYRTVTILGELSDVGARMEWHGTASCALQKLEDQATYIHKRTFNLPIIKIKISFLCQPHWFNCEHHFRGGARDFMGIREIKSVHIVTDFY